MTAGGDPGARRRGVGDDGDFLAHQGRLRAIAYRMLGTPDDADDVVQEAWLRWHRTDRHRIDDPGAWLTTVTTRLAIDRLRSAQRRREVYVGPWLPEAVTIADLEPTSRAHDHDRRDPAEVAVDDESLQLGFLRVLETLSPLERAAFLLHDVFGYPFDEVAPVVQRSVPATRQLAKRARDRVRDGRPRLDAEPADVLAWANAFLGAVLDGRVDVLVGMLATDVVHVSDGGSERRAARRPVEGPDRVARLLVNLAQRDVRADDELHWLRVNGQVALYVLRAGRPFLLTLVGWRAGRATEILAVLNPTKLARFEARRRGR